MLVMQKYNVYKVQVAPRLTGDPVVFRKNWRSVDSLSRHEIWGYRKQTDRKPLTAVNDPALKGGACDSPEVRMIAEAVSFLKWGLFDAYLPVSLSS